MLKYISNTLKIMEKKIIIKSNLLFIQAYSNLCSNGFLNGTTKLLFALVFKKLTLEARSLHSTTISVVFSAAVSKSDHSYVWFHGVLLFKHLHL